MSPEAASPRGKRSKAQRDAPAQSSCLALWSRDQAIGDCHHGPLVFMKLMRFKDDFCVFTCLGKKIKGRQICEIMYDSNLGSVEFNGDITIFILLHSV